MADMYIDFILEMTVVFDAIAIAVAICPPEVRRHEKQRLASNLRGIEKRV